MKALDRGVWLSHNRALVKWRQRESVGALHAKTGVGTVHPFNARLTNGTERRQMQVPEIRFTKWVPWAKRLSLMEAQTSPGVYDPRSRIVRTFTRYVEDLIYWQYVQRYGKRSALDYAAKPGFTELPEPCCCSTLQPNAAAPSAVGNQADLKRSSGRRG